MSAATKIEWCDSTFNPWRGCTPVSNGPEGGCLHCYAAALSKRTGGPAYEAGVPRWRTADANWRIPRTWNAQPFVECMECGWRGEARRAKLVDNPPGFSPPVDSARVCPMGCGPQLKATRRRVFCASLADVFDNEVDPLWRTDLFKLIAETPDLDWLLLTKRIGNAGAMIEQSLDMLSTTLRGMPWPWPNVWLGATVVTQAEADRDVAKLLTTRAVRRFVSIEPMLGPVDLTELQPGGMLRVWSDALRGRAAAMAGSGPAHDTARLDWVIVGGESGAGARPMVLGWAKDVVRQCQSADVPVLVKQIGAHPTNREGERHPAKDRKGGDMAEWPPELRVRQFPRAEVCHG
jgi:protein gp37